MDTHTSWKNKTTEELLEMYAETKELELKQEIVMRYTGLLRSIALQMRNVYLGFTQVEDMINEGVLVMMNAVDKYDSSQNAKFKTYISKRIKGMIIDLARKQDWIPRSVRKSVKDVENAVNTLHIENGQYPTEEQIAEYLQIPLEKYYEIVKKTAMFNVLSLDMILAESQNNSGGRNLPCGDDMEQPETIILKKEVSQMLVDAINTLKEKEQIVISLYYVEELNMRQIADILEISEPRVSQIHSNAIKKIRKYVESFN